jgi:hypothetical protein
MDDDPHQVESALVCLFRTYARFGFGGGGDRSPDWIKVKSAKFPAMNRPKDAFS